MLSDRVQRLRLQLSKLYASGQPMDDVLLFTVISALILIEGHARDLEEASIQADRAAGKPGCVVIPFPRPHRPN